MTNEQREAITNQIELRRDIIEDLLDEICYYETEIKNLEILLEMIVKLTTQSVSDIITNSSSEVFVVRNLKSRNQELQELITSVMTAAGLEIDDILSFEVASTDGKIDGWNIKYKKGDMLIWSADENSIPYWLMEFIEQLNYNHISRYHLG